MASAARDDAAQQLESETIAYYTASGAADHDEESVWAEASARAVSELDD